MARSGTSRRRSRTQPVLITSAPDNDQDLNRRQTKYLAMMSLRVICFVAAIFLPGIWRWVAVAGAAFLPAIAVVIANAVDLRERKGGKVPEVTPSAEHPPALGPGPGGHSQVIIHADPEDETSQPVEHPADRRDDGP